MITLYAIKPGFQNVLRPLARWLHGRGVTANRVTLAALLISLAAGGAVWLWPMPETLLLLPPVLLLRMALNALDGMLAREFQGPTPLGAILNEVGDVLADAGLYLPLALMPGVSASAVVALVLLALLAEFCGVLGVQIGASRRYDGPLGKSDRALVFGVLGLAVALGLPPAGWQGWIMPALCLLLSLTVINRVRAGLAESRALAA